MNIRVITLSGVATLSLLLNACGSKFDLSQQGGFQGSNESGGGLLDYLGGSSGGGGNAVARPYGAGRVEVDWGVNDTKLFSSGVGSMKLTTFYEAYPHTYCFENTKYLHMCQVAGSKIREKISSEPVAIQGFQLNFSKQSHNRHGAAYKEFAIQGGWVATAELRFNTVTGAMVLGNANIETVHNGACDLADVSDPSKNTVGYLANDRILTGLYLADEYSVNAAAYNDAHIKAARISYSGLIPAPKVATSSSSPDSCSGVYCWRFENPDKAVSTDMGLSTFQETDPSTTATVSGYFGLTKSSTLPRWDSHVVIGFCLRGKKVEANGAERPLMHYVIARTHKPSLVFFELAP